MNSGYTPDIIDSWYEFFFGHGHWHGVLGWHLAMVLVAVTCLIIGHHFGKQK